MIKNLDYFLASAVAVFILMTMIFAYLYDEQKTENQELEKEMQELQNKNSIIYSYYYLEDGIHKSTYFLKNNSYTIHNPFTCDNKTYYGEFHTYLENCGGEEWQYLK